jgi:outer membrane receptor protein involved in Fe transport
VTKIFDSCWRNRIEVLSLLLLGALAFGTRVVAQDVKGTILGSVTDSSGAAVAQSKITVRNVGTNLAHSATTDDQGRFSIPDLDVGTYEVQGEMTGFKKTSHAGVNVTVGSHIVVDLVLQLGSVTETVMVQEQVSQVETTSSALGNLVEPTQLHDLPLNGRNYTQLLTLGPGVQTLTNPPGSGDGVYGRGQQYSVSGSRSSGAEFLLDNANIASFFGSGTGSGSTGESIGVEAIAEFETLTNTYSAQYGGSGAVLNAVSKSGTNLFHGTAYGFLRNSKLDARNRISDPPTIPPFRRFQFGGGLGGPIVKDKGFFYVNYEGLRQLLGVAEPQINIPDANTRAGMLPDCVVNPGACTVGQLDPVVGGNSNVINNLLPLYGPIPANAHEILTSNGDNSGLDTYATSSSQTTHENYVLARFDYVFSDKDSLFVRYVNDRGALNLPSPIPFWGEADNSRSDFATIEEKHILSQNTVNLVRFSFMRPTINDSVLSGTSHPALQYYPGSTEPDGQILCCNLTGIGGVGPGGLYLAFIVPSHYVVGDDILLTHGAHSLKFGMSEETVREHTEQPFGGAGEYFFSNLNALLQGTANFYFGNGVDANGNPLDNGVRDYREQYLTPYIQDDWRVTQRLTLNLGLRYEWTTDPSEGTNSLFEIVNPPMGAYQLVSHVTKTNLSKYNFDPRIGLAFDPFNDHKTSIRAGFGIFHDVVTARNFAESGWTSPPYVIVGFPGPVPFGPASAFLTPNLPFTANQAFGYQSNRTPHMIQYNLTIQRDLGAGMIMTIGYVGAEGRNLMLQHELNPPCWEPNVAPCPTPTPAQAANPQLAVLGADGQSVVSNVVPNPSLGSLYTYLPIGHSYYNSLQTSLNHRFGHGWQAQASYTYSHSLDETSESVGLEAGSYGGGAGDVVNPYNTHGDYGPSTFDRRHNLTVSGEYTLPFHGNRFIEGWQWSGIATVVSGFPFAVSESNSFGSAGLTPYNGATERVSLAPGCTPQSATAGGNATQWYNPSCFTLPDNGQIGFLGDLARGALRGPGLINFDMSLLKTTKVTEGTELQFRAEFFNIFNHINLGAPNTFLFTEGGQTGPNSVAGVVNPQAGQITQTATNPRQIQFGLKFNF